MVCPVCGNEELGDGGYCPTCRVWSEPPAARPAAPGRDWRAVYVMSFLFFPVAMVLWAALYAQPDPDYHRATGNCLLSGLIGMAVGLILVVTLSNTP